MATRNIAQGDLIFQEPPLTAGAFQAVHQPDNIKDLYFQKRASAVHSSSVPWVSQTCLAGGTQVCSSNQAPTPSSSSVQMLQVSVASVRVPVREEADPQG